MAKYRQSLDSYDEIPRDMRLYLSHYGWHFSKKLCDFAASVMFRKDAENEPERPVKPFTKQTVDDLLKKYGVEVKNNILHDAAYVATMCRADFLGSSIADEQHMALFVKDTLDDPDAPDGTPMTRWYATMVRAGIPVEWSDML